MFTHPTLDISATEPTVRYSSSLQVFRLPKGGRAGGPGALDGRIPGEGEETQVWSFRKKKGLPTKQHD